MPLFTDPSVVVQTFRTGRPIFIEDVEIPLYLIPHNLTTNTVDSFVDTDSIVAAGAAINSPAYTFVANTFAGNASPTLVKIGRADLDSIKMTVQNLVAKDGVISVNANVNGVTSVVSYTVLVTDTTTDLIATGLAAALTSAFPASADNPSFAAVGSVITATPGNYKCSFGYNSVSTAGAPDVFVEDITAENLVTVLTDVRQEDDDFFFVAAESKVSADVVALSDYVNTVEKIYLTSTADPDVADSGNTVNIAITLKDKAASDTIMTYLTNAAHEFPEAAIIGNWATNDPTTPNTLNFKELPNITVDTGTDLTTQERITLVDRYVNYYHVERKRNRLKQGTTMSGEFADVVRFSYWMTFAARASIDALMQEYADRQQALPYDDDAAKQIESRIWTDVINPCLRGGSVLTGFTRDDATGTLINLTPIVDAGTRAGQTNANITNRIWDGVEVEVVYAGAIHQVKINQYIVLNRDPV